MPYLSNRWAANEKENPSDLLTSYCSWPPDASTWGVHLNAYQPDLKNNPMSWWPYIVLLLATRWLYQGVHLGKICLTVIYLLNWALENCTGYVYRLSFLFLALLLLLCNDNDRWTITTLNSNNNNNSNINVHKLLNFQELISPTLECMTYLSNRWPANEQIAGVKLTLCSTHLDH